MRWAVVMLLASTLVSAEGLEIEGLSLRMSEQDIIKLGFFKTEEKGTYVKQDSVKAYNQCHLGHGFVVSFMIGWDHAKMIAENRDPEKLQKDLLQKLEAYFERKLELIVEKEMTSIGKQFKEKDNMSARFMYSKDLTILTVVLNKSAREIGD